MKHLRWSRHRKHAAVQMIRAGMLDRADLMSLNGISEDEMAEWERDADLGLGSLGHSRKRAYQARRRGETVEE